ncbi:MAG: phosphate ABC transporter permease subunit PstC [Pirellulaceae bacterium]
MAKADVARPAATASLRPRRTQRIKESLIRASLIACAVFSILVTVAIVVVLFSETFVFFTKPFPEENGDVYRVSAVEFFTSANWSATSAGGTRHFGIWSLICGTLLVTAVAMAFALPLGLITAIYLSEYAPRTVRAFLKPTLEVLAGIPTVVYGFFALTVLTPALKFIDEGFNVYNAFSAGIAVGILCLPTVSSLSEDALRAVPRSLREGGYGLGGTRFDVSLKIVLPAALSGIISAFLLAIARAIGETMIVALAAGNTPRLTVDPRDSIQTMTGFMVQMASGDLSNFDVAYFSLYAVAATLFVITFSLTVMGQLIRKRFREAYQ